MKTEAVLQKQEDLQYEEILARRSALVESIQVAKNEYQEISAQASTALNETQQANRPAVEHEKKIQYENKRLGQALDYMSPEQQRHLEGLNDVANKVFSSARELEGKRVKLNEKVGSLQKELAGFDLNLSVSELRRYQDDLAMKRDRIDSIKKAIEAHEKIIDDEQKKVPPVPGHTLEREDLLAEIATGSASPDDLAKLDELIAKEQEVYEKKQSVMIEVTEASHKTIAGLNRLLATAESELEIIESKKPVLLGHFLKNEIERAGKEYVDQALLLVEKFEKILALDRLAGQSHKTCNYGTYKLVIPMFNTPACQGRGDSNGVWEAVKMLTQERLEKVCKIEVARLANMGVDL
jgi:hypothetical protein